MWQRGTCSYQTVNSNWLCEYDFVSWAPCGITDLRMEGDPDLILRPASLCMQNVHFAVKSWHLEEWLSLRSCHRAICGHQLCWSLKNWTTPRIVNPLHRSLPAWGGREKKELEYPNSSTQLGDLKFLLLTTTRKVIDYILGRQTFVKGDSFTATCQKAKEREKIRKGSFGWTMGWAGKWEG